MILILYKLTDISGLVRVWLTSIFFEITFIQTFKGDLKLQLRVDVMDHDEVETHWFVPDKGFEEIYSANEYCFDSKYPKYNYIELSAIIFINCI